MRRRLNLGNQLGVATMVALLGLSAQAATWHVAGSGCDTNQGSATAPFASLPKAIEAAAGAREAGEIVLHAGTYTGGVTIPAPPASLTNVPSLVIRAATNSAGGYEEVVVDGGQKLTEAKLVDAARGIYFFPIALANYEPSLWEADKRLRYPFVADRRAVEVFPGSLAPGRELVDGVEREGVFFRTSDSQPPTAHDLGLARDRKGFVILRPNVTVRGLRFRNFQLYFGVCGISIEAANVTVDSCDAWNCWGGFMVSEGIPDAKILNCTARDVATGVKTYGRNTVVEDCRFFRIDDAFVVREEEQDQCGIQFYSSHTQTARRNLCVGFQAGIFVKASGGVLTLENNTVVASAQGGIRGVGPNTWRPGSVCRGNVVVGFDEPIGLATLNRDSTVTGNLIWLAANPKRVEEAAARIKAEAGGDTLVAPPLFVDEARGDYRLAPASAGATAGPGRQAIGAVGAVGADCADRTAPVVRVEALPPAQRYGLRSRVYTRKNTWIGGKEPDLIEDRLLDPARAAWITSTNAVTLQVRAEDILGKPKDTRFRIAGGDWTVGPYRETLPIVLPKDAPLSEIVVQVSDTAGNWSEPALVRVITAAQPPRLLGKPAIVTSGWGAIVTFKTDVPCTATLEWGVGGAFDQRVEDAVDTSFRNDSSLGFEWTQMITGPRTDHCLAVIPTAKPGTACAFRLTLGGYGAGEPVVAEQGEFTFQGPVRTLHVATTGADREEGGTPEQPFATLQFAVDRALPGDRVLVAPGVYTGGVSVTHGGVEGHPIRIESAERWAAVLDGGRAANCGLRLSNVAHVQISGFEIRWFEGFCVLMVQARDILVEDCKGWSRHWVKGRPGPSEGIGAYKCARIAVDRNLLFALNSAFRFSECDGLRLTGNTAAKCFHRVAEITYSAPCTVRNNSFAFGSSYLLALTLTEAQVAAFDSDYNNLAVNLRADALAAAQKDGMVVPPGERLKRDDGFYFGESKSLASLNRHNPDFTHAPTVNIPTLTPWRERTGRDKHSIFVHPRYADPQNRDFRLLPDSPNIGAGENGVTIGALGVRE